MKKLIFILALLVSSSGIAQNSALFEKGNQAYSEGNYDAAVEAYTQILANGEASAELHYNLGNTYYKLNRIAPSIYHYEKALQLDPGDDDIQNNLTFAQNMAIDAIEEPEESAFQRLFDTSTAAFSPTQWAWVAVVCISIFVFFFLGYYFSRRSLQKRLFFISGTFFFLLAFCGALISSAKLEDMQEESFGIIFAEEVEVKSEPAVRASEVFLLHEGAKVEITEDFEEWFEIQLPNGSQGWIEQSQIKRL